MGIRLIVEVLDHYRDHGLTMGERDDLIVLAVDTGDVSRETCVSPWEDYIVRRSGKTARSWRNAIGALLRKGALEHLTENGRRVVTWPDQHPVYRIPVLCPDPPHDGRSGECTFGGSGAMGVRHIPVLSAEPVPHLPHPRADVVRMLAERDGPACLGCGYTPDDPLWLDVDHVMPRALGGGNDMGNLQLLCRPCNQRKGSKHPDVWRASIERNGGGRGDR